MKKVRVAINGFGRIGRAFMRLSAVRDDLEIIAINDPGDIENLAYLLRHDTAYGRSPLSVSVEKRGWKTVLVVNGVDIEFTHEYNPEDLPWGEFDIDVVVESTGFFVKYADAKRHLDAGAKRVVISAPAKGDPVEGIESATVLMGINEKKLQTCQITSNASCTTNASSPVIQILHESVGIDKALLTTVHGYTSTQSLIDRTNAKDWRKGRAAAQNIIPSTTGAAIAVTKAITELEGKFDGISMRVPVITGSIADITFIAKRETSVDEVNEILREAASTDRWSKIFTVATEPLVSSDIIGETYASIADPDYTRVVGGTLVKVLAWYDNEMGYTHALLEHVVKLGSYT